MRSLKNIWTISGYETRVLWRNWFFRILAIAGIFFLTIFNLAVFSEMDTPRWFVLSNSWFMPYSSLVLISIPQVAAVIFLATGLIKKDKKVDTNEVFFVRPITNLDYVLGKALALFKLFFGLNLVLIGIPLIINLTNPNLHFNPLSYVVYPLLVSVPTIVFVTGLSFLVVTLIRNQPVTIVLLLGISAVQLIYYFDQFSNILDFSAFRLSMLASEIVGFVDISFAIQQRLFYFITGVGLLFITSFFLDRLPGTRVGKYVTGLIGIFLLGAAGYLMFDLWKQRGDLMTSRDLLTTTNSKWANTPNIDIVSHHISLTHSEEALSATSNIVIENATGAPLDRIFFTLNPGLDVLNVIWNQEDIASSRDNQFVVIENVQLKPGERSTIRLDYEGIIDERVAHLEVDQKRFEEANDYFMYSLHKKYAFQQPDFVLLTKDVLWYPDTQVGFSRTATSSQRRSFIDFSLNVTTADNLVAVSQGHMEQDAGTYRFTPEYPLPQISLAIGMYQKKEIIVDSIAYSVYHYPESDYFTKQLGELSDTLTYLISDIAKEYEDGQKLRYPFRRLQLVETPIQFTGYSKIYEGQQALVQPETVYLPEEGGDVRQFDFRRQLRDMNRQAREQNQELREIEKQANVFSDMVKKVFTKQIGAGWFFDGRDDDDPDYSLYPHLYSFNSGIVSAEWELLNQSMSAYLRNDKRPQNDFSRNLNGVSFTEECNTLMRSATLSEILTSDTEFNKMKKSVTLKGSYLFSYLGQLIGEQKFKAFLYDWINAHQHQLTTFSEFQNAIMGHFGIDIKPLIQRIYSDTKQPAFVIENLEKYEVLDGDRKRYQVLLDITNAGDNDGVVELKLNPEESDENVFFNRRVNEEVKEEEPGYLSIILQGQTKQLGFVVDEKPDRITINTMISQNIPSVIHMTMGTMTKRNGGELFAGERFLEARRTSDAIEIIVDNEDEGFSTFSPVEPTYLRAYLDSRETEDKKYHGKWFRSYSKWLATTGSSFYGDVVRSAHFTRSGKGEKSTTWTPELQEEGFYDVYVYMMGKNQNEFVGRNNSRQYNYHYVINHGDGEDQIQFNITNAEPGWNYLGSYYFNTNDASVSLTDKCELRTVYADAIKWVKQ